MKRVVALLFAASAACAWVIPTEFCPLGVGVAEAEWSPAELSPVIWLDASDSSSIILESGKVSTWADKSGNGRNAVQTNATYRPVVAGGGVRFPLQEGLVVSGDYTIQQPFTIILVASSESLTAFYSAQRILQAQAPDNRVIALRRGKGACIFMNGVLYNPPLVYDTNKHIVTVRASNGFVSCYLEDVLKVDQASNSENWGKLVLGNYGGRSLDFSKCYIYEVIVLDNAISEIDRTFLSAYLSAKWAL